MRAVDCILRDVAVPFTKDALIAQTIKFQAETAFHSVSIDDFIIQYSKYAEGENKSRLLVAGCKKNKVERRLGMLEELKIDPVHLDLDVAALATTYHQLGVAADHRMVVIVELEANNLSIAVLEDGKLRTARSIRKRFGERRKGQKDEGESARLPVVILDDDGGDEDSFALEDSGITSVERESILAGIFREIDKTITLTQSDESVDFMCITGASAKLPGIEEMFEEHFEVEVRKVELEKHFSSGSLSGDLTHQGAVPLGLALKGLGADPWGMDFRQEEFIYQGRFEKLKKGLACTMTILFLMCFLLAFGLKQDLRVKVERRSGVNILQRHIYTVMFPAPPPPPGTDPAEWPDYKQPLSDRGGWSRALTDEYDRLANVFGGAVTKKAVNQSALDILKEFSDHKARCKVKIDVARARITQDATRINCVSDQEAAHIALVRELEKSEMFTARSERITRKDGQFRFDVVIKLKVEEEEGARR